jgi:zinc protease
MQIKNSFRRIAMTITWIGACGLLLQAQPKAGEKLPFDGSVRRGKLTNGFTYYIRHNEEPKQRVVLYLVNKVGSVLEDEDQRGLAHFMEHMSFNGTKHYPKNALVDYLQKSGVRFGADLNAYTSFDETVYQLPLPSDQPEIMTNGIQIMRDWAQEATLDAGEIDKERGVVLEEKRLHKGAGERLQEQSLPFLLNKSRYAERVPIGLDTVLNHFGPETIRRFYHDWYRPDLQALVVVGDINVDQMEMAIKLKFGDLKNPVNEKPRTQYTIPLIGKNQFLALTDKEMTGTTAEVLFKHPEGKLVTRADYRKSLVENLFNELLGSRYGELSRRPDAPFLSGSAGISGLMGGLGMFGVSVKAKPGELEKGFKAAWRELERVKQHGFTSTEFERAKTAMLTSYASQVKEKDKVPSENYVKEYMANFLKGEASPGIVYEAEMAKELLGTITLAEVGAILEKELTTTNRDILIEAPEKDKGSLPNEATVLSWMKAVATEKLAPYQDEVSSKPLLTKSPVPGKISKEQYDIKRGITTLTLSNGVKVLLKKTAYKNDEVLFNGFAPGGLSLYPDADYQSAAAANIVPGFGAGNYNTTELQKYLSNKQLGVRASIGDRMEGIGGTSVNADLETALQLIYAYFTEPRLDAEQFKGLLERSKASLAGRMNDPKSVFSDTVNAVLGNHSMRKTGPSLEKISQIDVDKAYRIYKERFSDASGFTFVFVGSIDTVSIKPLIEQYLGSLPALNKREEAKDLHLGTPEGVITRTVYKGSEPQATVDLFFTGDFDYSFANVLKMDALKETLEIRLLERLREDESGVYSPSTSVSESKYPRERFGLTISFGCAPQNVEKLIASALDELEKIKKEGPAQVNVDKFRVEEERQIETQLKTNAFWMSYITGQLQNKESLDNIDRFGAELDKITPADVKAIANQYITGKNYIRLVLMPEKTAN